MSDITLFFKQGWENIWKEKLLWLFSALALVDPLIRFVVPIQKSIDLPSSLFYLVESFASLCLMFVSNIGISYIAYCIIIGNPVNIQTTFQTTKKLFWRVVALTLLLVLFFVPCLCSAFFFSFKQSLQIVDVTHNFFFTSIPLSIFTAMGYFVITETIANNFGIGKSLKTAWAIFTYNFAVLAIIGVILTSALYVINISIGAPIMLIQNNFDFTALGKLDYISPHLSFKGNNFYGLITAIAQTVWHTYSTSIFTLAYLIYSSVKIKKNSKS